MVLQERKKGLPFKTNGTTVRAATKVIVRPIWLGESLMGIIMRKLGKCTWLTWLSKDFCEVKCRQYVKWHKQILIATL